MNEIGGLRVVGLITGGCHLKDIQMMVPHKIQVYIPAEKALQSKDLYRALAAGTIFKLDGDMGFSRPQGEVVDPAAAYVAEAAPKKVQAELAAVQAQNQDLQKNLAAISAQLAQVLAAVGRIESAPRVQYVGGTTSVPSEVVGDETPMFIPSLEVPENAQIQVNEGVSESAGVTNAASKLRDLRKGKGKTKV